MDAFLLYYRKRLGGRLTVGRWALDPLVGVRIPPSQLAYMHPDLILLNGNIVTVSSGRAEALAIKDQKIAAVGSNAEIKRLTHKNTKILDLKGKTVLPGFIDAHTHLVSVGLRKTLYLDLSETRSLEEALERVREAAKAKGKGEWVMGRGWDESRWPQKRYITRSDLDRVAPHNPIALVRVDGHMLTANTKALAVVNVSADSDEMDKENGILREQAATQFLQQLRPSLDELKRALKEAVKIAHSLGVTSIHDIPYIEAFRAWQALRGELKLRVTLNIPIEQLDKFSELGFRTGFGDEWLKLGAVKIFSDGSIGAGNAALFEPYLDRPGNGKLNYEQAKLNELVKKAQDNGFQVMIHAIGDRAIQAVLEAFAAAGMDFEDRARIEHFELPTPAQIEQMKELGIIASMQPNFLQWSGPGQLYEARLGAERDMRINPLRRVLEEGVMLAFGSDCMPLGPLYGIHLAVNAPHEVQKLSAEDAIRCYTLNAAYAAFEEKSKGSIEAGKLADLVVLSEDPYRAKDRIKEIKVEMTLVGGERVF